ncbi:MAG: GGDEF domain-containing protein [Parvularculaceae bacterium]|nr:GGDEF domain-containing protein [Parvularculaceae bacterium]
MRRTGENKTRSLKSVGRAARARPAVLRRVDALLMERGLDRAALDETVVGALEHLAAESEQRRADLAAAEARLAELERLADADSLVGVLNRRAFTRELQRVLAMADRHNTRAALLFADVDGLKRINDAKGHLAGDAALARIARVLVAHTRRTDTIGRLGGDEFGLILAESDVAAARRKAAALADLAAAEPVGNEDGWAGPPFVVRLSCGVVEVRQGATVEETLSLADGAMYRMKKRR